MNAIKAITLATALALGACGQADIRPATDARTMAMVDSLRMPAMCPEADPAQPNCKVAQ